MAPEHQVADDTLQQGHVAVDAEPKHGRLARKRPDMPGISVPPLGEDADAGGDTADLTVVRHLIIDTPGFARDTRSAEFHLYGSCHNLKNFVPKGRNYHTFRISARQPTDTKTPEFALRGLFYNKPLTCRPASGRSSAPQATTYADAPPQETAGRCPPNVRSNATLRTTRRTSPR